MYQLLYSNTSGLFIMLDLKPTLMVITKNHVTGSVTSCDIVQTIRACVYSYTIPIVLSLLIQSESKSPELQAQPSEERNMSSKK